MILSFFCWFAVHGHTRGTKNYQHLGPIFHFRCSQGGPSLVFVHFRVLAWAPRNQQKQSNTWFLITLKPFWVMKPTNPLINLFSTGFSVLKPVSPWFFPDFCMPPAGETEPQVRPGSHALVLSTMSPGQATSTGPEARREDMRRWGVV